MSRIGLAALALLIVAAVGSMTPASVDASEHSAERTFAAAWVAPGGQVQVTISVLDYGVLGQVVEDLPDGFTFLGSSLDEAHIEVDGQTVRFNLLGKTGFTYSVNAPTAEGQYTFSGVIKNVDRDEQAIGGHTTLRVGPPPTPTPTHTPAPTPTSTPTPAPTATATPEPTTPPTPEPTATPSPTETPAPTPTSTAEPTATPTAEPTATPETVVAPTAAPTPTPTATAVDTNPSDGGGGAPGLLWLIVVIGGIGLILAVFLYIRARS